MSTAISNDKRQPSPVAELSTFMSKLKGQMALALPKHMNADRMTRLALTAFSTNPDLQKCSYESIAGSIMVAAQMGLEPGVNGQGYLIPYGGRCTFVPGWKGIVDISNRSGRASVWTGAVFVGDEFDYAMGDRPFITHKPGPSLGDADDLLYVYAVGRVKDSEWPIIEVWNMAKIWGHRDHYNKQGKKHYSFRNPEMYARKIPLLQVLKYMPTSIEMSVAIEVSNAAESGRGVVIEGNFVTVSNEPDRDEPDTRTSELPLYPDDQFARDMPGWKKAMQAGKKTPEVIISLLAQTNTLTDDQQAAIRALPAELMREAAKPVITYAQVADKLTKAKNLDELNDAATLIGEVSDPGQRKELTAKFESIQSNLIE